MYLFRSAQRKNQTAGTAIKRKRWNNPTAFCRSGRSTIKILATNVKFKGITFVKIHSAKYNTPSQIELSNYKWSEAKIQKVSKEFGQAKSKIIT